MKKLFTSAVSMSISLALLSGNIGLSSFADEMYITPETACECGMELQFSDADALTLTLPDAPALLSNYKSGSYNYRDFLDANNAAIYDALEDAWKTPTDNQTTITLPETLTLTLSHLPTSSSFTAEEQALFNETVFGACKSGLDSLFFDQPEIFWIDQGNLGIGFSGTSYSYSNKTRKYTFKIPKLIINPQILDVFGSAEKAKEYSDKLTEAVDSFVVEGDTRYEQIKSIHDQISYFTYYDTQADFASMALGALVEPGVVCEGYSKGFKLICDRLDIPCVCVFGNYDRTALTAHMWNDVLMDDGKWYGIDITWDDLDGDGGKEIKYSYFLKGSDGFWITHDEDEDFDGTIFTYPELSTSDYDPNAVQPVTTTTTTTTSTTSETTTTTTTSTTSETTTTTTTSTTSETTTTTTTSTTSETTTTTTTSTTSETTTTTTTSTTSETTTTTTTSTTSETTTTTTTSTTSETTTSTALPDPYLHGDFNKDGSVNIADLLICMRSSLNDYYIVCDYDDDGVCDVFDVISMRKLLISMQ